MGYMYSSICFSYFTLSLIHRINLGISMQMYKHYLNKTIRKANFLLQITTIYIQVLLACF